MSIFLPDENKTRTAVFSTAVLLMCAESEGIGSLLYNWIEMAILNHVKLQYTYRKIIPWLRRMKDAS